jgi:hypothetical protein
VAMILADPLGPSAHVGTRLRATAAPMAGVRSPRHDRRLGAERVRGAVPATDYQVTPGTGLGGLGGLGGPGSAGATAGTLYECNRTA